MNFNLLNVPILLLGTHADLLEERKIGSEEAIEYSKKNNFVGYYEISSKTGYDAEEAFDFITNCIYQINFLNKTVDDIFETKLYYM